MTMNDAPVLSSSASFDNISKLELKSDNNDVDDFSQLKDELITSLKSEIQDLKSQLESSKQIYDESIKLNNAKSSLESSNQSLQNRMNICLEQNDQLKKNLAALNDEKEKLKIKLAHNEMDLKEIEITKNRELKVQSESEQNQKKLLTNMAEKNSKLLFIASNKFRQTFQSIDDFTLFLQSQDEKFFQVDQNTKNEISTEIGNDDNLIFAMNKLKKKVRKYKSINKELQNEISTLNNKIEENQKDAENVFTDLKNKLKEEKSHNRNNLIQFQQACTELKAQNSQLKKQIKSEINSKATSMLSMQPTENFESQIQSLQSNISKCEEDLKGSKKINGEMKKKIKNLLQFLHEDEIKQNELEQTIQSLENRIQELSEETTNKDETINQIKSENKKLETQNQTLITEKETLNQLLKKSKSNENNLQTECQKFKNNCSDLQQILQKQKSDLQNLTTENQKISKTLLENQEQLKEAEEELTKSNNKINDLQFQVKTINDSSMYDRSIPVSFWFNADLPRDLSTDISSIGQNEKESIQYRIQKVLALIANYIKTNNDKYTNTINDLQMKQQKFNQALKGIVLLFNQNQFDDLDNEKYFEMIEWYIKDNKNSTIIVERQLPIENEKISKLMQIMNANSFEDAIDRIQYVKLLTLEKIKKYKTKNSNLKIAYNQLIDELNQIQEKCEKVISNKNSEIDHLKNGLEFMSNNFVEAKQKLEDYIENQIQKVDDEQEKTLDFEVNQQRSNEMCLSIQNKYENDIQQKNNLIKSLETTNKKLNKKLSKFKNANEGLNQDLMNLNKRIESMKNENQIRNEERQKCKEELKKNELKYNETIEKSKSEVELKNQEIQKLNAKIQKAKTAFANLKDKYFILSHEEKATKTQLSVAKQEIETLKTKSQTSLSFAENNYKIKIGKIMSDNERKIRDIYQMVADAFVQFYDPKLPLDEKVIRNILDQAKRCLQNSLNYEYHSMPAKNDSSDFINRLMVNANEDKPNEFVF